MPKGKRKYKSGVRKGRNECTSDEESVAGSVVSNLSDLRLDDSDQETPAAAEEDSEDQFEDRLKDAIEGTLQKSVKGRVSSLELIKKSLSSKFVCQFVLERRATLCDVVERSVRRGKGEEQSLGSCVGALVCAQLGPTEGEEVFLALRPILQATMTDNTLSPTVRAQCATSLGLCCFISCMGSEVVECVMSSLFVVALGGVKAPSALHSSALQAWALLLTTLPHPYIDQLTCTHLRRLHSFLESSDVDLRIAAGETLALFYEMARSGREEFVGWEEEELCDKLRLLATDGQKFRAKKDRRTQRSSFRDILAYIEERVDPVELRVRVGTEETLYVGTFGARRHYDAFCQLLGTGMSAHLRQNDLLREVFQLGPPLPPDTPPATQRNSKVERHCAHLAADKERTKFLSRLRDKRADVC